MSSLWTKNFILACLANFLLYFAFYMLLPTLPLYLIETFQAQPGLVGTVLSSYIAAALIIRPFSGYLLDTFSRKPLYFLSYLFFVAIFAGYLAAGTLLAFTLFRILHGFTFGTVSVAGSTVVIDILPSSRRGEGLGYFGITNNLAMAFGPMAGLLLNDATGSFSAIFLLSIVSGSLGIISVYFLRIEPRPKVKHPPLSLDRFFLLKGIPACINIFLLGMPYAMMTTYVALYAQQLEIGSPSLFFTLLSAGLIGSRLFSGARVDKGQLTPMILLGISIVAVGYLLFSSLHWQHAADFSLMKPLFFGSAFIFGMGYGTMFPAFTTLFVQLAHNHQRGTAMSTYLTGWDLGTSMGLLAGGFIAQSMGYHVNYLVSVFLCLAAWLLFRFVTGPHFGKNKIAS
ncbi:MAG: MFS transporter [Bacteroidales bacterium]